MISLKGCVKSLLIAPFWVHLPLAHAHSSGLDHRGYLPRQISSGLEPSNVPDTCQSQCATQTSIFDTCSAKGTTTEEASCLCTSSFENAALDCLNCLVAKGAIPSAEVPTIQQSLDFFRQTCSDLGLNVPSAQIAGAAPSVSVASSSAPLLTTTTPPSSTASASLAPTGIASLTSGGSEPSNVPPKAIKQGIALIVFFIGAYHLPLL